MPMQIIENKHGQRFVKLLIAATILLFVIYYVLHEYMDESFTKATTKGTFEIKKTGEVVLLDLESIIWIIGEEKADPVLKRMQTHTEQIRTLMERLYRQRDSLRLRWEEVIGQDVNLVTSPVEMINTALADGEWQIAYNHLSKMGNRYRNSGMTPLVSSFDQTTDTLRELSRIKEDQINDSYALTPPKVKSLFWTTPHGSILEVLFFAIFGVLTNLLVKSAEYLRKGQFKESERWVAYIKMVYGPVLAVIMVIAIIMGWFDVGDYETRAYTLPLFGFIFGYYARKTATLFDKLATRVLGASSLSIENGPANIVRRRAARIKEYKSMMIPKVLPDLRKNAEEIAKAEIKTKVINMEAAK
ncbi:MAG: hypothetical protein PVG39_08490 [Desulfobacteraceae bacterium]